MENNNLAQNKLVSSVEAIEEWSKPEIKVIAVNETTLGPPPGPGPDCGDHSGSTCT